MITHAKPLRDLEVKLLVITDSSQNIADITKLIMSIVQSDPNYTVPACVRLLDKVALSTTDSRKMLPLIYVIHEVVQKGAAEDRKKQ
jgi:hypothetical protein